MFNALEVLKKHFRCNHTIKFELFPKASFGNSNDFVYRFCTCTLLGDETMKNHSCCLHAFCSDHNNFFFTENEHNLAKLDDGRG